MAEQVAAGPGALVPVVKFNGSNLASDWLAKLIEIRVDIQYRVPARVTLRFADPGYELVKDVRMGTKVEVGSTLVTGEDYEPIVTAEITSVATEQRPEEHPELVLVAMDGSYRLGRTTKAKTFLSMSYSDVVTQLVQSAKLTADVGSCGAPFDYLVQAGSDLALVTELAQRSGFDWWVTSDTFHFKKPAAGDQVKLTLGGELLSFSARASSLWPGKVTVGGWDRKQKQDIVGQASAPAPPPTSDLAEKVKPSPDQEVFTTTPGVVSQEEADLLAEAMAHRGASGAVTAKGVAAGNRQIVLGATAVIDNAGPLSGHYPITGVEHVFRRSGFVTRFTSGERGPGGLVDALGAPAGLPVGYPGPASFARRGVAVAIVTSIDDPAKSGRVKVKFTAGANDLETDWARVVTVGGGAERGSVWIPEVNDEVLIAFEDGDARTPVVIGGLYSEKDKMPVTEIKGGLVQSRALTSRKGHVIAMFDGEADPDLAIEMALQGKEHKIRLAKNALDIQVPSGKPVTVKAGDSKIEFSSSGDITISAPNITLKADQAVKIQALQVAVEAKTALDLKSDVDAKLAGSVLDMKGTGVAKLAGGMVQIN